MNPDNKQFLDDNLHHFECVERADYCRQLGHDIRQRLVDIMAAEFRKGYTADLWCGNCVMRMIREVYRDYHNWLKGFHNDKQTYRDITEGITEMNKLPLTVRASFPEQNAL